MGWGEQGGGGGGEEEEGLLSSRSQQMDRCSSLSPPLSPHARTLFICAICAISAQRAHRYSPMWMRPSSSSSSSSSLHGLLHTCGVWQGPANGGRAVAQWVGKWSHYFRHDMAACKSQEHDCQSAKWKHGVFTHSLAELVSLKGFGSGNKLNCMKPICVCCLAAFVRNGHTPVSEGAAPTAITRTQPLVSIPTSSTINSPICHLLI